MTRKRLFVLTTVGAVSMAALGGCIKDREYGSRTGADKVPIVLTQANVQQPTRGVSVPDGQLANGSEFDVTAYYYPGGAVPANGSTMYWNGYSKIDGASVKTNDLPMLEVPYKVVSGLFESQASSQFYWPEGAGDKLRFFAYMPRQSEVHPTAELQPTPDHASAPDETWTLRYKLPEKVIDHHDLLVAVTGLKGTGDETSLSFGHALTRIDFKVRRGDGFTSGEKVVIKEIVIHDVLGHGLLTVDPNDSDSPFRWREHDDHFELCDLTLSSTGDHAVLRENWDLNSSHQSLMREVSGGIHYIMAIPMNTGGWREQFDNTHVEVTAEIDGKEMSFTLPLAGTTPWAPGKKLSYLLTVYPERISWDWLVEDWEGPGEIDPDLSKIMLEVSRTSATINEHNKARIWFKTNHPDVTMEMESINGVIPVVDWDEVADDLTGENPRNFQYWWDETSGLYVGYIDIETDRSKRFVGSSGNHGIFYINAGGLRRKIKIDWENVPDEAMPSWHDYPYVGAFWRHNEKGERLICNWLNQYTLSWTATVDAGDFIVLEKGKTLDERVWTDLEPGDPENYPVEGTQTEVSGTGWMYFRIGLTDTIEEHEVRYGRIQVKLTNGNGTFYYYIYVRQGEAADYLMREGDYGQDVSGGDIAGRSLAVKFSPYNLTADDFNGNGTSVQMIDVGSRGGTWTDYPSQAGAFFRWAHTDGVIAYNAAVPNTTASPSPTWGADNTVSAYWGNINPLKPSETIGQTYESCPPGYRRPTNGSAENLNDVGGSSITGANSEMGQSLFLNPPTMAGGNGDNLLRGYYADGFFDRRIIKRQTSNSLDQMQNTAVSTDNSTVAYLGYLFYNKYNQASLFFPSPGLRGSNTGGLAYAGEFAFYWSSSSGSDTSGYHLSISNSDVMEFFNASSMGSNHRDHGFSVRCVKDE